MADDVAKLAKKLKALSAEEFSIATAAAVNRVAHAVEIAQGFNVQREFTLRNKYTMGSLRRLKATPKKDANKIDSIVGSRSEYLDDQDVGGVARTRRGRPSLAMPSKASRRGNWGKPVTARYRMDKIKAVGHRGQGGRMTPRGTPFFFLEGGKLKNKTLFERRGRKLIRVRVVKNKPTNLKATRWHSSARDRLGRPSVMAAAFNAEINKGLTKLGAK